MDDLRQTLLDCHKLLKVIEQRSAFINGCVQAIHSDALGLGTSHNEPEPALLTSTTSERETNGDCHYLQKSSDPPNLGQPPQEVVDEEDQERQLPWLQHLI